MTLLQSHITEHVGYMARALVNEEMAPKMQELAMQAGGQIPEEQQQQMQLQIESLVAMKIAEIIEQMVGEEQEMFDNMGDDPLVDLKQQEIDLKKEDLELKAQVSGEKQAMEEKKLAQKDKIEKEKMESTEDIAQLKANVALDKAGKDRRSKEKVANARNNTRKR